MKNQTPLSLYLKEAWHVKVFACHPNIKFIKSYPHLSAYKRSPVKKKSL